jgi:hypothetical protein
MRFSLSGLNRSHGRAGWRGGGVTKRLLLGAGIGSSFVAWAAEPVIVGISGRLARYYAPYDVDWQRGFDRALTETNHASGTWRAAGRALAGGTWRSTSRIRSRTLGSQWRWRSGSWLIFG